MAQNYDLGNVIGPIGPTGIQGVQGAKGNKGDPTTVNGKTGTNITLAAQDIGSTPISGLAGNNVQAVLTSISEQISPSAEKPTPSDRDYLVLDDSADAKKKRWTFANFVAWLKGLFYTKTETDLKNEEIATELGMLKENKITIPIRILDNSDLNNYKTPGMFFKSAAGETVLHTPVSTGSFSLLVEKTGAFQDGVIQTFSNYKYSGKSTRSFYEGIWREWIFTPTTAPPQEFNLPFASDLAGGTIWYSKDQFSLVRVELTSLNKTSGFAKGQTVAVMPVSYRPKRVAVRPAVLQGAQKVVGAITIGTNGTITVDYDNTAGSAAYLWTYAEFWI